MKKLFVNCLSTTALTLLTLAVIAFSQQAQCIFVVTVFQAFFANALIHIGLYFVGKIESRYFLMELLWEVGYVLVVLTGCGYLFNWYSSTPLWMVILMGIVIYAIGCFINIMRIRDDISEINHELQKRDKGEITNV